MGVVHAADCTAVLVAVGPVAVKETILELLHMNSVSIALPAVADGGVGGGLLARAGRVKLRRVLSTFTAGGTDMAGWAVFRWTCRLAAVAAEVRHPHTHTRFFFLFLSKRLRGSCDETRRAETSRVEW